MVVVVTVLQKSIGTSRGAPTIIVGTDLEAIYDFFYLQKLCSKIHVRNITVTLHCLQRHLPTYKHNYMFRDIST